MRAPAWLTTHLGATGRANTDGVRRQVTAGVCRRCSAHVLTGLDADVCAVPATVDPDPIDAAGELLALVAGRGTYNLVLAGGRAELDKRNRWMIAGRRRWPVVAAHVCGAPPLPAAPVPPPSATSTDSDVPPF